MKKKKKKGKGGYAKKLKKKEPLLKSAPMMKEEHEPISKEILNKADITLKRMMHDTGIPRQKVKMN